MSRKDWIDLAQDLFQEAYEYQLEGDIEAAIDLCLRSIEIHPTAEAHTFLGWTYSFKGRLDEAIEECRKAIRLDPDFGTPYNDIGSYLIEQSRHEEAIPWLEQALKAPRYDDTHSAYHNLGRAYTALDQFNNARESLERAIHIKPDFGQAQEDLLLLKKRIH